MTRISAFANSLYSLWLRQRRYRIAGEFEPDWRLPAATEHCSWRGLASIDQGLEGSELSLYTNGM